jgi:hypothetical protein
MRQNQERTLVILVILVLVVVGTSLIGLIWGIEVALGGAACLISGAALIGGLWFLLSLLQKWIGE